MSPHGLMVIAAETSVADGELMKPLGGISSRKDKIGSAKPRRVPSLCNNDSLDWGLARQAGNDHFLRLACGRTVRYRGRALAVVIANDMDILG